MRHRAILDSLHYESIFRRERDYCPIPFYGVLDSFERNFRDRNCFIFVKIT